MPLRLSILALPMLLGAVSVASADDLSQLYRYMLPPMGLTPSEDAAAVVERPAVTPVEAPRPVPPVEIVTTPVGAINISCAFVVPTLDPIATLPQVAAVAPQPVEAARPQ